MRTTKMTFTTFAFAVIIAWCVFGIYIDQANKPKLPTEYFADGVWHTDGSRESIQRVLAQTENGVIIEIPNGNRSWVQKINTESK